MAFSPLSAMALPYAGRGAGKRDEFGVTFPPGGRVVAYVHHSGESRIDDTLQQVPVLKTLKQAVNACRAGFGDIVLVLPGHAENIAAADYFGTDSAGNRSLKAGTRIIGLGHGDLRPAFTWTAAASTMLIDVANVLLSNLRLLMDPGAGTVNVAAPMIISAAGCVIEGCQMRMGTDANSKVTIGVTTTAAADDLTIANCDVYGAATAAVTTCFQFVGADRLKFVNNLVQVGTSSTTVGVVRFLTTASLDVLISDCFLCNKIASSTVALTGMAGLTGLLQNSALGILAAVATGGGIGTVGSLTVGANVMIQQAGAATAGDFYPATT